MTPPSEVNEDQFITIGNKPDFVRNDQGEEIKTEPYLRALLDKLIRYKKVWIRVMNHPEKLGRLQSYYEILKHYAIVEIENRRMVTEPHKSNPDKKFEYIVVTWEIHPKLQVYREIEIYRKMKDA